jgi:hypothetical protein
MPSQPNMSGRNHAFFTSAHQHPNLLALLCTNEAVYFSGPASIWKMDFAGAAPKPLASVPLPWPYRQAAHWRHLRRLGRLDVRELIQVPGGGLLGISQKQIISIDPVSGDIRPVFQVTGGGRPKGFAIAPSGHLFVGEYWGNPQRQSLRIWASLDGGDTWELAHTLASGSAQHIHNIVWDPHRLGLWVLTGDGDGECAVLFTPDEFKTVTELVRGSQLVRACQLFCEPEGLFYGTDTERAPNWFVHLEVETGKIRKIQPLPGSCIHAARLADRYWLSTSVEPSKINRDRKPALWFSEDLQQWTKLVEFQKDWWPGEYFGFGSLIVPRAQGACRQLVFSAIAVKHHDFSTFIVKPEALPSLLGEG